MSCNSWLPDLTCASAQAHPEQNGEFHLFGGTVGPNQHKLRKRGRMNDACPSLSRRNREPAPVPKAGPREPWVALHVILNVAERSEGFASQRDMACRAASGIFCVNRRTRNNVLRTRELRSACAPPWAVRGPSRWDCNVPHGRSDDRRGSATSAMEPRPRQTFRATPSAFGKWFGYREPRVAHPRAVARRVLHPGRSWGRPVGTTNFFTANPGLRTLGYCRAVPLGLTRMWPNNEAGNRADRDMVPSPVPLPQPPERWLILLEAQQILHQFGSSVAEE